jgi:hypothetical protein
VNGPSVPAPLVPAPLMGWQRLWRPTREPEGLADNAIGAQTHQKPPSTPEVSRTAILDG